MKSTRHTITPLFWQLVKCYHLINHCFEIPNFSFNLYGNTIRTKSILVVCRIWESQDWGPGASSAHPLLRGARSQSHWMQGSRGPRASASALVPGPLVDRAGFQGSCELRESWGSYACWVVGLCPSQLVAWPEVSQLFSCPVVSNSLQPHGLQHSRPPYPTPSPKACPSSYSLHRWCHPAILSSDALFSWTLRCPTTSAKRLGGGIRSPGTVKLEGGFQTATCQHQCPQTPVSVSQGKLQLPPASPGSSPRSAGRSDQQTGPRVWAF